ncbi:putative metal-dependent HD superfamily phosphohydrolase [Chryseobacterium defluvii]|uniref:Putative metal-dependent HD superfamily phosphohydrolase n=1 Tax=Chryseobacterium defluvii TaxID=160396 RepID=A0A840KCX9_9FLAO|nr:HD domain-containing protein [Chryseobacterium defluvii]MBB4805400.1 putative metal-dependent HD superfamily phosphohydrolase [Chryseobacterium defluvii]
MENLIEQVKEYAIAFLTHHLPDNLHFHTVSHTIEAVEAAIEIGRQSNLTEEEMLTVETAAWFHDCGYTKKYIGHEQESKRIAAEFLEKLGCRNSFIETVLKCIDATRFPQNPGSIEEKVLCDADLYHFARINYPEYEKAIRLEFETCLGRYYTDQEWSAENYHVLTHHHYHTDYGKKILTKFKKVNIQLINERI